MNKHFCIAQALLASMALVGAIHPAEAAQYKGENLLQPMPLPGEGWESRGGVIDGDTIMEWKLPNNSQLVMTRVFKERGGYPAARFREVSDAAGEKKCTEFESSLISDAPVNGFQRVLWQVTCARDSHSNDVFLHLYITGTDSNYWLMHKWSGELPSETSLQQWAEYFGSVSVCDSRKRRNAPCS